MVVGLHSKFHVVLCLLVVLFMLWRVYSSLPTIDRSRTRAFRSESEFCGGEHMTYSIAISRGVPNDEESMLRGRKFNCSLAKYLYDLRLSDQSVVHERIMPSEFPYDVTFVFAADVTFYESLRTALVSLQDFFQDNYRNVVVYDLGGISKNETMVQELKKVCKLELREFNFTKYPAHVRVLKTFAWKIVVMAEMHKETNTFIYCDTSINFITNDYRDYFSLMKTSRLLPVQFTKSAHHGIRFATHSKMLEHIPLNPDYAGDIEMHEANMMLFVRNRQTHKLLKWAVLCALERECIDPVGSSIACYVDRDELVGQEHCHRQDQSVLSILVNNEELAATQRGFKRLIPHQSYLHPSKLHERHLLLRRQRTNRRIVSCQDAVKDDHRFFGLWKLSGNQSMRRGFVWIKPLVSERQMATVCASLLRPRHLDSDE